MNYGNIIYVNRQSQGLKLRELEKLTGITHEKISRFERNVETPSKKDFQEILDALKVDLSDENDIESQKYYDSFFNGQFFQNINNKEVLENLSQVQSIFLNSNNCHLYYLIQYVCKVLTYDFKTELEDKILSRVYLQPEEKQVYLQYQAVKEQYQGKLMEALVLFEEALTIRKSSIQDAMIHYQMGMVLADLNRLHQAKESIEIAREQFYKNSSLIRLTYSHMVLGGIYTKNGEFSKAFDYYQAALNNFEFIPDKFKVAETIKRNIIWIHICSNKYKKALELLDELEDKTHSNVILFYCCCYVKLRDYVNLEKWIIEGKKYIHDNYSDEQLMRLFKHITKDDDSANTLKVAKQVYAYLENISSHD